MVIKSRRSLLTAEYYSCFFYQDRGKKETKGAKGEIPRWNKAPADDVYVASQTDVQP